MFYVDIEQELCLTHNSRDIICKEHNQPIMITRAFLHSTMTKYFGISDRFAAEVIKEQLPIGKLLSMKG